MRGDPAEGTCWFDELFEGGIVLPVGQDGGLRALTILLSGPPGSGKSTLATELCVRAARSTDIKPQGLSSLYVTLEAHKPWMIGNAVAIWPGSEELFQDGRTPPQIAIAPIGSDLELHKLEKPSHPFARLIAHTASLLGLTGDEDSTLSDPIGVEGLRDILVIDSLNTIHDRDLQTFRRLMSLVSAGPKIIVIIANSRAGVADFAADVVISLDRNYEPGYLIRTIEVVKARYQPHVWGKHQLKFCDAHPLPMRIEKSDASKVARAHPYREEGGIFIFPSIHYVLSRYKTKSPSTAPVALGGPIKSLNDLLDGGIPRGRCTALVGARGTHKSHLGYMEVLHHLVGMPDSPTTATEQGASEGTRALVVSLRDDEAMTASTLDKILKEHWRASWEAGTRAEQLVDSGRLEITYFPPGFITPEEFFHRLLLSINRLKADRAATHVTVLFNSLDQLSSRFPLCASQTIFIPGVIQMLSAEGATSVFVAAESRQGEHEHYGLLSMADLILSLQRTTFKKTDYMPWLHASHPQGAHEAELSIRLPDELHAVQLEVVRFAGGQPAGATGILELVKKEHPLYEWLGSTGLVLIPCIQPKPAAIPLPKV